jgi:hypothetical protein
MFTKTSRTPTTKDKRKEQEIKPHPFKDPLFKPKFTGLPKPEFRRQVEQVLTRYDLTGSGSQGPAGADGADGASITIANIDGGHPDSDYAGTPDIDGGGV